MSFNGSGSFLINTAGQPVVSGTVISSTAFNALTADLATGLSTCITKDGQTTVTANIPMANYKFTGLGAGSGAADSANLSQVQSTVVKLLASVSGTDTITAVGSPTVAAYAAGQMFYFVAAGDNTGAVTINIDSLGAKAVTRDGSVALAAGDIKSGEVVVIVYDGTRFQVVSQLNSAGNATFANVSITSALNVGGVATFSAGTAAAPSITTSGDTNNGIFFPATDVTAITTAGSERLRVDASGNMGLGVTPSAWGSIFNAMQLGDGGFIAGRSDVATQLQLGCNGFYDGSNFKYIATGTAARYYMDTGAHYWENAASGSAGGTISFTQAMTLTAGGNLLLGTTGDYANLLVGASSNFPVVKISRTDASYNTGILALGDGNSTTNNVGIWRGAANSVGAGGNVLNIGGYDGIVFTASNAALGSQTERARITSGGNLVVGRTTTGGFAGTLEATQTGSGAVGSAFAGYATNASYGYYVLASFTTRSATSETSQYIAYSNDGNDVEFNLRGDGNGYADGTWNNNGADYAEFFESATGAALTVGATVVLDGNKVREATASDSVSSIMGVVRPKEPGKASMMVGNTAWNKWANKYLTDDFDRYIMEDHNVVEWTDADGKQHSYESHRIPADVTVPFDAVVKTHDDKGNKFQHYKLNPAYNPDSEYTPREKRDEWIIVGLVGQVKVLKGKPVNDRWIKMRDVSATVEEWMIR